MFAYKAAIDETVKTIDKRAKCYRNSITVVLITCFCSIGSAVVTWTLAPVAGLLLVFTAVPLTRKHSGPIQA